MPRPRRTIERLSRQQNFRLTEAEHQRLHELARACGMSSSDFCRSMFLTGRIVHRQTRALPVPVVMELNRIGVNLNQQTRRLHETGQLVPEELSRTLARLSAILDEQMGRGQYAQPEDEDDDEGEEWTD